MERSGPDDARDDAPDDAWDDDAPTYPVAPLPAHERNWRHPSEIGEAAWVRSEPPVTIGRGLLVTSGAIGSALGVAVLYLLLPAGGSVPSASPTATSSMSSIASLRSPLATVAETPIVTELLDNGPTEVRLDGPGLTLPAPDTPSTMLVMAVEEPSQAPLSIAVAIEGAPYIVTTAHALESIGAVNLLGPGDAELTPRMSAELVSVEGDLAYLAPSAQMEVVSFASTAWAEPGQTVTVLSDDATDVSYVAAGTFGGVPELDAGRIVEGTPVIDDEGALVALCTVVIDGEGAFVEFIAVEGDAPDDEPPPPSDPTASSEPVTDDTTTGDGSTGDGSTGDGDGDTGDGSTGDGSTGDGDVGSVATVPTTNVIASSGPSSATTTTSTAPAASSVTTTTTIAGATGSTTTSPAAWVGLRFDGSSSSAPLTISGVVAGSPAMIAGVMVGERVTAVDGTAVATIDDVIAALKRHRPGDVMKLSLAAKSPGTPGTAGTTTTTGSGSGSGSGSRTISVVLAAYAPTL